MRGLPAKYAKMGFAKGWREYRKVHKTRATTKKVVGVKKVAKRRYRRRARAWVRRRKPKMPLEVGVALTAIPFTGAAAGWETPFEAAKRGDWKEVFNNVKRGFLGINEVGEFDLLGLLNPFDMDEGRYVKMLIAAGVVHKIRTKLVTIPFDKIPLIGKYIS